MQKSQVGLLRALLYRILKSAPDLVKTVCSDHYPPEEWEIGELNKAFQQLSQQTILPAKYCFFIDGLDEYDGEAEDINKVLTSLAKSPCVKICVSSRPWPAFEEAFEGLKYVLIVQNFTLEDMKVYVENRLEKNINFQALEAEDPRCRLIVTKIAERAQGVWLWVYLVTRDLRRALNGKEKYEVLEKILYSFPENLEEYFDRIIKKINPIFQEDMSQIFLITLDAVQPLPMLAFTFLRSQQKDHNYAINQIIQPMTDSEVSKVYDEWFGKIHNRCGDLLTVRASDNISFFKHRVDFLHRTVRDFLRDNYYANLRKSVGDNFSATLSLCYMMLALVKRLPASRNFRSSINQIIGLVDELLYYAHEVERSGGSAQVELLDNLDSVISEYARGEYNHWTHARDLPRSGPLDKYIEGGKCTFLALTVQARLVKYVGAKLDSNSRLIQKFGRPLLDYALRPKRKTPIGLPYHRQREYTSVDVEMVQLLLGRGANPNQVVHLNGGQTVWGLFLLSCYENASDASEALKDAWYQASELLVDRNADSGWHCSIQRITATEIPIDIVLSRIFGPKRAGELVSRMARQRKTWPQWIYNVVQGLLVIT